MNPYLAEQTAEVLSKALNSLVLIAHGRVSSNQLRKALEVLAQLETAVDAWESKVQSGTATGMACNDLQRKALHDLQQRLRLLLDKHLALEELSANVSAESLALISSFGIPADTIRHAADMERAIDALASVAKCAFVMRKWAELVEDMRSAGILVGRAEDPDPLVETIRNVAKTLDDWGALEVLVRQRLKAVGFSNMLPTEADETQK